ncbi:McrC family protein [Streptomyces chromofuscus]|uniref:Restriction endonuclease n=1 Tax=Streptomyces chromofuscus TaxID=42881 RepID=A0A7M2TAY3_STRCW|nr:restriction endonuclease [Streptomyces chromofuscus]QOV45897.1 restriction endonuclease [Streptomyces chromofuscus]GGT39588.1 McrBC 5-methylcytosine restriction system component [Streptomyces chromofuscus]
MNPRRTQPRDCRDTVARIRLAEGGGWTTWDLTPAQVATLAAHDGLVHLHPETATRWRLKARDRVGSVRLGTGDGALQLTITPKVPVDRLLHLVSYAPERVDFDPRPVTADARPDLLPALAHAFVSAAERALLHGVLHDYRETCDTLPVVRGRIRHADQLRRRPGVPVPLEVAYDDHTPDIPENRLLLAAARRLLRVPGLDPAPRSALQRLTARLDGVRLLPTGAPTPRWTPGRRNARYAHALVLAELVLRGASYELGDGREIAVDGMLMTMWRLFEAYLARAVGEALRLRIGGRPEPQDRNFSLDVAGRHVLKPDLVHYLPSPRDGSMRQAVVLDAKFKTRPQRGDLYQMTAYCVRLGLAEGHLVYASGRPGVVEVPVGEGRLRIWRHVVDLSRPWRNLASDIDGLAESVDTARSGGAM